MTFEAQKAWGWAAAYAVFIFAWSSMPRPLPYLPGMEKYPVDKIFHVIEYGFFGWLLIRAWRASFLSKPFLILALAAFLTGAFYGATDEWHQSFVPQRESSARDWAADSIGVALGIAAWAKYKERKIRA